MNSDDFRHKCLSVLESFSNSGDSRSPTGSRLIGHRPDIAPRAYVHIIYPALNAQDISDIEMSVGRKIPEQYKDFLKCANGLNVFSDSLRIFGFVPTSKQPGCGPHEYPFNVIIANSPGYIPGLSVGDFVVGWYKNDNAFVLISKNAEVSKVTTGNSSTTLEKWKDIDTWLSKEIVRLNSEYRSGNIPIFIPSQKTRTAK